MGLLSIRWFMIALAVMLATFVVVTPITTLY